MRVARRYWMIIIIAITAVAVARQVAHKRSPEKAQDKLLTSDPTRVSRLKLLRCGDTLLLETIAGGGWLINGTTPAADNLVLSLTKILRSITIEMPAEGIEPDSLSLLFNTSGLTICVTTIDDKYAEYSIAPWEKDLAILQFNGDFKTYTISVPGYSTSFFSHLSLDPRKWSSMQLGVRKPSDILSIDLQWTNDSAAGFHLTLDSLQCATLRTNASNGVEISYDTLNMAAFLYAFTSLTYSPATDTLTESTLTRINQQTPYLTIGLVRRRKPPLKYEFYHIDHPIKSEITGRTLRYDPNHAILRLGEKLYVIELSDWDTAMPQREDLQNQCGWLTSELEAQSNHHWP